MRVLIVGDVHGNVVDLAQYLAEVKSYFRIAAAIQVGDFGFFPNVFDLLEKQRIFFPIPLYAIDGNHEDHLWLSEMRQDKVIEAWAIKFNLHYLSRVSISLIGGKRVGAIGGALHVDRPQEHSRDLGVANYILKQEREEAISLFNMKKPDLIVSHSCPTGIGIGIKSNHLFDYSISQHVVGAGFDPGVRDDCGDRELTEIWKGLCYRPKSWVFGHFHFNYETKIEGTHFVCNHSLDQKTGQKIVVWDTDENSIYTLDWIV